MCFHTFHIRLLRYIVAQLPHRSVEFEMNCMLSAWGLTSLFSILVSTAWRWLYFVDMTPALWCAMRAAAQNFRIELSEIYAELPAVFFARQRQRQKLAADDAELPSAWILNKLVKYQINLIGLERKRWDGVATWGPEGHRIGSRCERTEIFKWNWGFLWNLDAWLGKNCSLRT